MAVNFDFAGALRLAKKFDEMADDVRRYTDIHDPKRDTALKDWEGPKADEFKILRDAHDRRVTPLIFNLRRSSAAWVTAWHVAVKKLNMERYEEAQQEQADYNRRQLSKARSLEAGQSVMGGDTSPLPSDAQKWLDGHSPRVDRPAEPTRPTGFRATESFVRYAMYGDRYVIAYGYSE